MLQFDPKNNISDLTGKVILVTGGNSGLGEAAVAALAQHNPGRLYVAARSRHRAEAAVERIRNRWPAARSANIDILDLDLASLESVTAAAERINREVDRLDILQLCGGIAIIPATTTREGYEIQFGTNYLGHALLTQLLMPKMLATAVQPDADVRIVSMASSGHRLFPLKEGILFDKLKTDMRHTGGAHLYGQAMLSKILFAYELAKRYPLITSTSLHPGTVKSAVWSGPKDINWFMRNLIVNPIVAITGVTNEEGVKTQLWCSFSKHVKNGTYYLPVGKPGGASKAATDDELSKKLWEWTEKELKAHGAPGWPALK
jgi:NAD(P)-dependent dehydrogenase (short-subunit alcohol dehydrogenase family)